MKFVFLVALVMSFKVFANSASVNIAYNDIRRIDEVVNFEKSPEFKLIELNDGQSPYIVDSVRKINANLVSYSTNDISVSPETFDWTTTGLFPIYNSYVGHHRAFDSKDELDEYKLKIPYDAQDLEEWKSGDSIYYSALGGLGLYLSLGQGAIGLGPKVSVEGGFSVYIEKKSPSSVFVEIRKVFTHNYSLLAGTWGVYMETSRLNEATKGINFVIDLSTEKGRDVYEKLVRVGAADFAQTSSEGVIRTGNVDSDKVTRVNKVAAATPFIPFLEFTSGRSHQVYEEHRDNIYNQESDVIVHQHQKQRSHRIFSKKGFTRHTLLINAKNDESIDSASLEVSKRRTHFKTSSLKRAIKYVYRKTKLDFFKDVELNFDKEKLRYGNVSAKLIFNSVVRKNFVHFMGEKNLYKAVKKAKKFLKSDNFVDIHSLIKKCGGSLVVKIEGERITRSHERVVYPHTLACPYTSDL